ncbi:MAG: heme biosynthesis HemY N-terminal domain-containing protein [Gammaproteobacteria bacterium]|nr:heme biosynthesis HemY N-terminal domain-containing protein [Gammaproteobacteria bacterium]
MKSGFAVILSLIIGALAANYLLQDNGYVLIHFRGTLVEMSVPILVLVLVLAYLAVRFFVRLWRAPRQLGEMAAHRRMRKAGDRIVRGYIEMGEGNFARGEKLLTKGVRNSETPLLNYLVAARAAQAQGDRERRDNWLKMAYDQEPRAAVAVLLTQAELQLENDEFEIARATLNKVLELTPRNPEGLRLKAELCISEKDWAELEELLPKLLKLGHVPEEVLDEWYVTTWCALLGEAVDNPGRIKALWKALPRRLREQAKILRARIRALIADGQVEEAENIIRKALNNEWSEGLILLYGELEFKNPATLLNRAESWLRQRPEDPALLLTAARLCERTELWGKARSYYESSNGIRPSPQTWHELGQLMLRLGEEDAASEAFEKGLTLSYGGPDVPRITDASLSGD